VEPEKERKNLVKSGNYDAFRYAVVSSSMLLPPF